MSRVISSEDLGNVYPCPMVDVNPYCQIIKRGYNMSCERCLDGNWKGPYWEQFLRQDNNRK